MLAVISPAKTLDYQSETPSHKESPLMFPDQAAQLVDIMRHYSPDDLQALMGISERLAQENANRFSRWQWPFDDAQSRAAVFAFKGDVYAGLDAYNMDQAQLDYLQSHLRILSGLYGLLRPLDAIMPYRLEMGKKVPNPEGDDLYAFWSDELANTIKASLNDGGDNTLINLASNEYFKSLKPYIKDLNVITPVFKDWKNGQYKMISFYAKKARGLMVRYMAKHRVTSPEELKAFDLEGYHYDEESSTLHEWVFLRHQDA